MNPGIDTTYAVAPGKNEYRASDDAANVPGCVIVSCDPDVIKNKEYVRLPAVALVSQSAEKKITRHHWPFGTVIVFVFVAVFGTCRICVP